MLFHSTSSWLYPILFFILFNSIAFFPLASPSEKMGYCRWLFPSWAFRTNWYYKTKSAKLNLISVRWFFQIWLCVVCLHNLIKWGYLVGKLKRNFLCFKRNSSGWLNLSKLFWTSAFIEISENHKIWYEPHKYISFLLGAIFL